MEISREMAIRELEQVRKDLTAWIKELRSPTVMYEGVDGSREEPEFPNGIPKGLSVSALKSIPVNQLRAELVAIAAKLEALAST